MSILNKLACMQSRKDELPNQQLARELAQERNEEGIREIARNLWNKGNAIQSSCIKVLYEIGYLDPHLIAEYVFDFIRLLKSRNNRLVWGGMIALATIAEIRSREIFDNLDQIIEAMKRGSVITVDNGIKTLSAVASKKEEYRKRIFPYLLEHLKKCRPKEVPMHAGFVAMAVDGENKKAFRDVLEKRKKSLKASELKRVEAILKKIMKK